MQTFKIPKNPCKIKKKTLKKYRKKIHKYNDNNDLFFESDDEAGKVVDADEEKTIKYINSLKIQRKGKKRVIPLHIVQVWHNKNELPDSVNDSINLIKSQNPEFKHTLFDEKECREFIKDNYPKEVLDTYDKINPHALKADLWRYCYLYKNGGIYLDAKYYCVNGFKLKLLVNKEYFCRDILQSFNGIYNAILICKPKNKVLKKCIDMVVLNVQKSYYGTDGLCSTGPLMIRQFFTPKQIDDLILNHEMLSENMRFIKYYKYRILKYHEKYKNEKSQKHKHWSKYWEGGKLYNNI